MIRAYIEERVERIPFSGCWIWMRSCQPTGYGDFRANGRYYLAHRAAYEEFVGPIPEQKHVLHRCDVPPCCNPDHLFLGTNVDNILDSVRKGRRVGITRARPSGLKYRVSEKHGEWNLAIPPEQRRQIREIYALGLKSQRDLAAQFGVSQTTINVIIQHRGKW